MTKHMIEIHRPAYHYIKPSIGKRIFVKPTSYLKEREVYPPSRNKNIFPVSRHENAMNAIAETMGYGRSSDVPDEHIDEYVDNLVDSYGEKSAMGMIRRQLVYRKRIKGHAWSKFNKMDKYLRSTYTGKE